MPWEQRSPGSEPDKLSHQSHAANFLHEAVKLNILNMMGHRKKDEQEPKEQPVMPETEAEIKNDPQAGADNEPAESPTGEPDFTIRYAELNDKYLRLYSDFDNYRKRTLKEKIEQSRFAGEELIVKLLPILDDIDRAIHSAEAVKDVDQALKEGIVLIYNKLLSILQQQGLEPMRAMGEVFDTDFHEAITNIPAPEADQKGRILDVVQKGFLLHGKVIRYAKVVVGS